MQQQHHLSNANNNYINSNAGMMNANSTANISPILHNNHIINNNHQHLHQTNVNFGGQMLSGDVQNGTYYQQHPFMQHQRTGDSMIINNTMMTSSSAAGSNGLSHIKNRNRLMKNNGLNNNFYRSSGINENTFLSFTCIHSFRYFFAAAVWRARIFYDFVFRDLMSELKSFRRLFLLNLFFASAIFVFCSISSLLISHFSKGFTLFLMTF